MNSKDSIRIALAGNPNSGKTTLFNELTGANQYVGNWPGVTVEKKEGKLKKSDNVVITDLPGIYSLSPYTLEEVVARNYLIDEHPDAILNIVDGTNLERNLYLTTQLTELGIPVVVAVNMMDIVDKSGDKINVSELSKALGCKVVTISALKGRGVMDAAQAAVNAAKNEKTVPMHTFSEPVEAALAKVAELVPSDVPEAQKRWFTIKLFERDQKLLEKVTLDKAVSDSIEEIVAKAEEELDDDAESIITNERYLYISSIIKDCYNKKSKGKLSISDKIDKIVTNRWLALPIFVVIMCLVYWLSVSGGGIGTMATDWVNDGVFGDGFHLFGMGTSEFEDAMNEYAEKNVWTNEVKAQVDKAVEAGVIGAEDIQGAIADGDFGAFDEAYGTYGPELEEKGFKIAEIVDAALEAEDVPDTTEFGVWVPSIPVLVSTGLEKINCVEWLESLIVDGIVAGVGAVLGFLPQMLVLFLLLAFLEGCGYMARIAFVLDRVFRRFGLSGKSFIPMLIGVGCGVPGVMASRTIENQRDRRMTIMTTTFIPCSAKLPIIALISAALFGNTWWVAPSAYFIGIAAIIISGIMLKKTKMFAGDPAPFVMELPAYHWPTIKNIFRSMWERASSFLKKAGTIILLATIFIWAGSVLGIENGKFAFNTEMALEDSFLGIIGNGVRYIFMPLGFGSITATVATVMGLVAKEEVVAVFGVLDFVEMTKLAAYSFLVFNLLCAPCFAAIGAIRREMNNGKWTWFAIGYQCLFAYAISLIIYQFGLLFTGAVNVVGLICAAIVLAGLLYFLFRPAKKENKLKAAK